MARGGITFSEVAEAAKHYQERGNPPTVDLIRSYLGNTGSRSTLTKYLKQWKATHVYGEGKMPQPVVDSISVVWDHLTTEANKQVKDQKETFDKEKAELTAQLQQALQNESKLTIELQQLREKLEQEVGNKNNLDQALQESENERATLLALHQSTTQQIENAKLENQRLHSLTVHMQANLEHYQQAIQQQQAEQNLAREKQYAIYTQNLLELKSELSDVNEQYKNCEKKLSAHQFKVQQLETDYEKVNSQYEILITKNQETERTLLHLQTQETFILKSKTELECTLAAEQQSKQVLDQKLAVLTDQLQRIQKDLSNSEDKVETLRHEKMFLAQEKAQLEGTIQQIQNINTENNVS